MINAMVSENTYRQVVPGSTEDNVVCARTSVMGVRLSTLKTVFTTRKLLIRRRL